MKQSQINVPRKGGRLTVDIANGCNMIIGPEGKYVTLECDGERIMFDKKGYRTLSSQSTEIVLPW